MGLASDIENFSKKTEQELNRIVRASCLELFSRIIQRTPVDTGRARGNWQIDIDNAGLNTATFGGGQKSEGDPKKWEDDPVRQANRAAATAVVLAEAEKAVSQIGPDAGLVTIYNNVNYIVLLEHGHSVQTPPNGMVRLSCQEFPAIVAKHSRDALC